MKSYEKLLLKNKAWVKETLQQDPSFFEESAKGQKPDFLWIGCSDSRVPAEVITNTRPGDIFVHRNIANMVVSTDLNMLSVLQYAVEVLKVKHIIVCGHYGCGGVKAAVSHDSLGLINKWLLNIKDVYRLHTEELNAIEAENMRLEKLVELNVQEQVFNLAKTSIVQNSWKQFGRPTLHGWVYRLGDGILKSLCMLEPDSDVNELYKFEL